MMKHKQFTKKMVATLEKMPKPEGFTASFTKGWSGEPVYQVENVVRGIRLKFRAYGDGTTECKLDNGQWYSFDRRGVEASFYWLDYNGLDKVDLQALIAEQLVRIAAKREFFATAMQVPDIGYSVSPETHKVYKKQLKEKGYISFYPSGFGTGYTVSTRTRTRSAYNVKQATEAAEKFWGTKPLWIQSFDCD